MAMAAERLLKGSGWLPEVMRRHAHGLDRRLPSRNRTFGDFPADEIDGDEVEMVSE